MRLELNLPALERLIGGDTELELHLRHTIVQEFAKRHLKEIAEKATYEAAKVEVCQHVNAIIKEHFGVDDLATSYAWPKVDDKLKSVIRNLVEEYAQSAVDAAVLKIIEYQKRYWGKEIENAVKKAIDRQIEEEVEKGIRQRLEAARKMEPK